MIFKTNRQGDERNEIISRIQRESTGTVRWTPESGMKRTEWKSGCGYLKIRLGCCRSGGGKEADEWLMEISKGVLNVLNVETFHLDIELM
ncbi:hypothetical protein DWX10_05890 [Clostridium sp. AF18-27]|uniref:hypothetical protein n=1 Tax=Enterocloster lavalensis TaxID=460384 RepID=UPI000E49A084|nr:hypothetical protein [Enterocloster lavalensis]MBS5606998.1 hypothetical protein [Enterocloster asparagiformis]RHR56233.1 hypothetical protein DWX10_05890 [Clostridium sp. AF18-27]